jgi:hypothetical protein
VEDFVGKDQLACAGGLADELANLLGDRQWLLLRRISFIVLKLADRVLEGLLQAGLETVVSQRHFRAQCARMLGDVLRTDVPGYVLGHSFLTKFDGFGL